MHRSSSLVVLLMLLTGTFGGCSTPSLEGTYTLVQRELPDGTTMQSPDIVGCMTFAGGHRNFNVYWQEPDGRRFSVGAVAEYDLRQGEYHEHNLIYVVNDEIGGGGLSYDLSRPHGSAPVKVEEGRMEFQLPLFGEPYVVFDADGFTATRPGAFVDRWHRID